MEAVLLSVLVAFMAVSAATAAFVAGCFVLAVFYPSRPRRPGRRVNGRPGESGRTTRPFRAS